MARKRTRKADPSPVASTRIEGGELDVGFGLSPIGSTGLKETGGWVYEEFHRQLQGKQGIRLYSEMARNSSTIGAIRRLVRDLAKQVKWEIRPAEKPADARAAEKWAEHVEQCRGDMELTWNDVLSEALSMIEYGFAPMEITYKLRRGRGQPPEFDSRYTDGRIGWRSIAPRAQETLDRWEWERGTRRLLGMWQSDWHGDRPTSVFMPTNRLILFRTESTKDNPEGLSLFRNAVDPYLKLRHIQTVELIGIERDLTGVPVMEVPAVLLQRNTTAENLALRREMERQMGSFKRHEREFLMIPSERTADDKPSGYKFRLQQGSGAGRIDVSRSKADYKTDIFQSCLAQFIQHGLNGNGGNRALSADQTDLFSLIMYSLLETLRETIQKQGVDRLCALNGACEDDYPQLCFGDIDNPNLPAIGKYITDLNAAGVLVPDEDLRKHLYGIAGLPYTTPIDVVPADELIDRALDPTDDLGDIGGEREETAIEDPGTGTKPGKVKPAQAMIDDAMAGKDPLDGGY